jgi:hypothetical protein
VKYHFIRELFLVLIKGPSIIQIICYAKGDFYAHILEEANIPVQWHIFSNYQHTNKKQ